MNDYRCMKCGSPTKDSGHKCEPLSDDVVLGEVAEETKNLISEAQDVPKRREDL